MTPIFPISMPFNFGKTYFCAKKHSVLGGCSDFRKVVFTWRQNHSFKYQGRGVFWNFFILQRNLKTSIISCCKKKYPSSTFFHSAHISQRPHILRILLKMLTCYFKNVGCAYFLRTTQMVFGGMLVRYIVPFFQFDRNYAWSQHYFAKYIYLAFFIWHTHLLSHVKTCFIRKLYNLIRALVVASQLYRPVPVPHFLSFYNYVPISK